jgi:hypothetical protein
MSVENKSVDITSETDDAIKYCRVWSENVQKVADLPCLWRKSDLTLDFTYYFCRL